MKMMLRWYLATRAGGGAIEAVVVLQTLLRLLMTPFALLGIQFHIVDEQLIIGVQVFQTDHCGPHAMEEQADCGWAGVIDVAYVII